MSAARNSFSTSENGTAGSVTFIRLTSPVRIIFVAIVHPCRSAAATIAVAGVRMRHRPAGCSRSCHTRQGEPGLFGLIIKKIKALYADRSSGGSREGRKCEPVAFCVLRAPIASSAR